MKHSNNLINLGSKNLSNDGKFNFYSYGIQEKLLKKYKPSNSMTKITRKETRKTQNESI